MLLWGDPIDIEFLKWQKWNDAMNLKDHSREIPEDREYLKDEYKDLEPFIQEKDPIDIEFLKWQKWNDAMNLKEHGREIPEDREYLEDEYKDLEPFETKVIS